MKKILPKGIVAVLIVAGALAAASAHAQPPAGKTPSPAKTVEKGAAENPAAAPQTKVPAEGAADENKCPAQTAENRPPQELWPHKGVFGAYDMAAVQRGFQVYREVCSNCHSLKFLSYRDLQGLGYTPEQVKTVAASVTVSDGPNDEGQMFDRPGRPSDHFKSPFPNDKAARAANNGALPPDMSLLVKAREHGEDYIYGVLTGYEAPPACATMFPGMNWNKYFPPHQIAMPRPLNDGQVQFSDGAPNDTSHEAKDVVQFLAWASEPHMEQRKEMGLKVLLFMIVFCGIMASAKCKVWEGVR